MVIQVLIGILLLSMGGGGVFLNIVAISNIAYPIIWWGLIFLIDAVNFKLYKASSIRSYPKNFFGVLVPVSVLFWLWFDFVNLVFPQWYYIGNIDSMIARVIFGFFAFATVIPIILEFTWLLTGPLSAFVLPAKEYEFINRHKMPLMVAAGIFFVLPFFTKNFALNQLIWVSPLFIFLPGILLAPRPGVNGNHLHKRLILISLAAVVAGLFWEFINFYSLTKWKYSILPQIFHIFEMPLPGYLGFIPFGFSCLAVSLFALKRSKPAKALIALLYSLAIVLMYFFVLSYSKSGLWQGS